MAHLLIEPSEPIDVDWNTAAKLDLIHKELEDLERPGVYADDVLITALEAIKTHEQQRSKYNAEKHRYAENEYPQLDSPRTLNILGDLCIDPVPVHPPKEECRLEPKVRSSQEIASTYGQDTPPTWLCPITLQWVDCTEYESIERRYLDAKVLNAKEIYEASEVQLSLTTYLNNGYANISASKVICFGFPPAHRGVIRSRPTYPDSDFDPRSGSNYQILNEIIKAMERHPRISSQGDPETTELVHVKKYLEVSGRTSNSERHVRLKSLGFSSFTGKAREGEKSHITEDNMLKLLTEYVDHDCVILSMNPDYPLRQMLADTISRELTEMPKAILCQKVDQDDTSYENRNIPDPITGKVQELFQETFYKALPLTGPPRRVSRQPAPLLARPRLYEPELQLVLYVRRDCYNEMANEVVELHIKNVLKH